MTSDVTRESVAEGFFLFSFHVEEGLSVLLYSMRE